MTTPAHLMSQSTQAHSTKPVADSAGSTIQGTTLSYAEIHNAIGNTPQYSSRQE